MFINFEQSFIKHTDHINERAKGEDKHSNHYGAKFDEILK